MEARKKWIGFAVVFVVALLAILWLGHRQRERSNAVAGISRASAFSEEPFTADMTIAGKTNTYHGKMYASRSALRTDIVMGAATASVIVRYDKGVAWILMPKQHYIETPIEQRADLLSALREKNADVRKQDLGPEQVGSYACEKYRVRVSRNGTSQSGWIWVAKAKNMDGFIVKAKDDASTETIEFSDIRFGLPPSSLFDLPPGEQKLEAPQATPAPPATSN